MDTNTLSRRDALRLFGTSLGAAAVAGTTAGMFTPASAATSRVTAVLDKPAYQRGEVMTLSITEDLVRRRATAVTDSTGLTWHRVSDNGTLQVWKATATSHGTAMVTATVTRLRDSVPFTATTGYRVLNGTTIIGMSSAANVWDQRVAEVGTGLTARRIFADLADGPLDQINLIEQAHEAGFMPVVSYKVGGNASGAASGAFNAAAEKAAARLDSYGLPTTVTYWHEPYGELTPAQYVAGNKQLLPAFKRGKIKVGPLLNGWLLDNNVPAFTSYCPDELFGLWDWFGIDTYESGTMEAPGPIKPAHRIPKLASYVAARGFNHPLGIGEYNGYSGATIAAAGAAILNEPNVWFGCMWNSTIGKGYTLTGDRLDAFRATLADPRARDL